ncbi:hypothetical protein CRG98_028845 [Punica granatum]|uniref:Uncharacterized protein n=1 Tax=Punica granatum TaxID=22663 RepID=A0A2I0J3T3_PUNGR|nr:hypothetical protein CRG98_028845 [Punica granatum]
MSPDSPRPRFVSELLFVSCQRAKRGGWKTAGAGGRGAYPTRLDIGQTVNSGRGHGSHFSFARADSGSSQFLVTLCQFCFRRIAGANAAIGLNSETEDGDRERISVVDMRRAIRVRVSD